MNEKLNEIFDLPAVVPPADQQLPTVIESTPDVSEAEDDYKLARKTLRHVINKGDSALEDIMLLARSSEHPRSYEVAGQIMKTMAEVAKDLLALQKQKQEISKPQQPQQIEQQNNIVFAGSTDDLLKMIKKKD